MSVQEHKMGGCRSELKDSLLFAFLFVYRAFDKMTLVVNRVCICVHVWLYVTSSAVHYEVTA